MMFCWPGRSDRSGTLGPDLLIGIDNSRFDGNLTHMIQLLINTMRTLQSQHHVSSGYQPCTAQLTSPRKLIPACESKNTNKNKVDSNSIAYE